MFAMMPLAAFCAQIAHHFAGGVYAKETRIPAGMVLVQHRHAHDHLSLLASGSVELEVDGERRTLHAPACLTVAAGKHHGVKALTDAVWFCIHATDVTDEASIDESLIVPADQVQMREIAEALV